MLLLSRRSFVYNNRSSEKNITALIRFGQMVEYCQSIAEIILPDIQQWYSDFLRQKYKAVKYSGYGSREAS